MPSLRFAPGEVFADRYRIVTCIGRGGMGEVWRADDLVLQTPVALKVIDAEGAAGRERILNEVRLARQVTHAAVCRVFDVGQTDTELFYSMELVQGEDLSTLLRRMGRLPVEKVRDIGQQLCAGLAAAHAQGVLHRDLKPANILMDQDGMVRITDFGIAVIRGGSGGRTLIGTPGYMAPEQFEPGRQLSERTDLYALGVVLYELLVGDLPFPEGPRGSAAPVRPSALVPDVDPHLERVILRSLALDPRKRPASAAEMADQLFSAADQRPRNRRPWLAGGALALVVGVGAALASLLVSRPGRALTDQDTIVVADFTNSTGEAVFDGTLKVALAIALEQSPFLKVFPDDRVREDLRLMRHAPDEPITRSVAREVARREQLKALVDGSIASFGNHYVLALEALNAETGDVMAREQMEVPEKEQVLTSLGTVTSRLREKLGESLPSIRRFDMPVARATTASLEALHAYSLSLDQGRMLPRVEGIPHLKRAIDLDPNFALAYAQLSSIYANSNQSADAPAYSRKAFELRDNVSERERFFISWRYFRDAEQAWDKALELSQSWTRTYPREASAFNSLGLASSTFGQYEKAADAFRESIRLDPKFSTPYGNLSGVLMELGKLDDARRLIRETRAKGMEPLNLRQNEYLVAFLQHDESSMAGELARLRTTPDAPFADAWEARVAAAGGRFQSAQELFHRGVEAAVRGGLRELGGQWTMEAAELQAIAGDCMGAGKTIASGLELSRDNFTLERAARSLALCGAAGEVSNLSSELNRRFATGTLTVRLQVPVIRAALALQRQEPARAIEILQPVKSFDDAPAAEFWPAYLRGQAYLRLKDGAAAAGEFRHIVDHHGVAPTSPLYALAHLGLARATLLSPSDPAAARGHYERFFSLWDRADLTLPPFADARSESARLQ